MSRAIQAVFGVRVTVLYRNGAKMRMRARTFDIEYSQRRDTDTKEITKATWAMPWLSWSRKPLLLNTDEIVAVWQGRA